MKTTTPWLALLVLVVSLPTFVQAADGADAIARFHAHSQRVFAQHSNAHKKQQHAVPASKAAPMTAAEDKRLKSRKPAN